MALMSILKEILELLIGPIIGLIIGIINPITDLTNKAKEFADLINMFIPVRVLAPIFASIALLLKLIRLNLNRKGKAK